MKHNEKFGSLWPHFQYPVVICARGYPATEGSHHCRRFYQLALDWMTFAKRSQLEDGSRDLVPRGPQLAGGVILGVALWLRHDPQTTNLLYLELGDKPAPNTFYVGIYILIAVGAVMMFVGFLGCYGAIQESQCLLGTFFTCLVILFACEVAAGIWGFVNKDQIAKDVKQFYDQALQQAVVDDDANNAKAVVKTFHETLDCCGSSTLTGLTTSVLKNNLCPSGSNIISNLLKKDCHQKIDDLFSGKLYLIGIAAIVVAVIMIFEMILSMVLCCGIRNSSVY
ncbi:PREDICTED: CD81 antigen isoform X1 [Colobus angolensis palliatus]|uniref:CD81 antigen isoform X1 n=1 Tax=Colobus angolensis palliatus TaxID=336983 RepID=UPI0005F54E3F|nr:PREDICTED: CD81 antigen isoform X1 [Colobus angolensis palliatus]